MIQDRDPATARSISSLFNFIIWFDILSIWGYFNINQDRDPATARSISSLFNFIICLISLVSGGISI